MIKTVNYNLNKPESSDPTRLAVFSATSDISGLTRFENGLKAGGITFNCKDAVNYFIVIA